MKHLYLALAIIGAAVPYAVFVPWLAENGVDIKLLVAEMFATDIAAFFSLDVIVSAIVVLTMVVHGTKNGVANAWLAAVGTCLVGVSLGLPLYLYLEARHREQRAAAC